MLKNLTTTPLPALEMSDSDDPITFQRSFKFESTAAAIASLAHLVDAAWWIDGDLSLLLEDRCLTVRVRWPSGGEDQDGALRFARELDRIQKT